jgi:alcohol dehydrogenase class IV
MRAACQPGPHPAAREDMAVASLFGGLALANAGLGAVHGFAGPIGGVFPAPHGAVCAALLPHVMATNCRALRQRDPDNPALARYAEIGRLVTNDPQATAEAGIDWMRQLVSDLKVPSLSTYGIEARRIPDLVAKSAKASSMKANPILLTTEELGEILRAASL